MARPTKLTPELRARAEEYLPSCVDDIRKKIVSLPSIEGFALWLDISRETLYQWEKEDKQFSDILERVRQEQAKRLLENGLSGNYNSTIAKLVLSKHNYTEKTETEHSGGVSIKWEE